MKFSVNSAKLLKHLSSISGVIATNPIVPILENFLFVLKDGKLTVTASDLQTVMVLELEVESTDNGNIAIPARLLLDTLRGLPDQSIAFTVDHATYGIQINTNNGLYKLSGENPTDFPKVPAVSNSTSVDFPSDILLRAITNTIFATSTDELRPAMTGVFLHLTPASPAGGDGGSTFVATDGHRLIRYRRSDVVSGLDASLIIPRKALNLLKTSLPSEAVTVKTEFNQANAFFSFSNIRMICRLIDERFPDYENAIPVNNDNILTIDRMELLNSLKRISIYSNRTTHQIRLKINGNDLQISAEDLDYSNEANERLTCEYHGEDLEIGFNARFIVEMLSNMTSKSITLELSAPNRAGLILPKEVEDHEEILMLVMPVMLNNYA